MKNPRYIIITGASSGIGAELARAYAAPGVAFGPAGEGRIRLCYAASLPKLSQALERLVPLLK